MHLAVARAEKPDSVSPIGAGGMGLMECKTIWKDKVLEWPTYLVV